MFHYNSAYVYAKSLRKHLGIRHVLYLLVWSKALNMSGVWREPHNEMGACMCLLGCDIKSHCVFMSASKSRHAESPENPRGSPQGGAGVESSASEGLMDSGGCWNTPQQVGCPISWMGKWTRDQRDGVGDHSLFLPSPNGQNRGRDVRVLGNLIYIPSLKEI